MWLLAIELALGATLAAVGIAGPFIVLVLS